MSEKDDNKFKKFVEESTQGKFEKPVNEWSRIVEQIEAEKSFFSGWLTPWTLGPIAGALLILLVLNFSGIQRSNLEPAREIALAAFLEGSQDIADDEDDLEDYSYLALIE